MSPCHYPDDILEAILRFLDPDRRFAAILHENHLQVFSYHQMGKNSGLSFLRLANEASSSPTIFRFLSRNSSSGAFFSNLSQLFSSSSTS